MRSGKSERTEADARKNKTEMIIQSEESFRKQKNWVQRQTDVQEETAALQKFVRGSWQKVHLHLALHMKQTLLDVWGRRRIPYCVTFSLCGMQEVAAAVAANDVVAVGVAAAAIVAAAGAVVVVVVAAAAAVDAIEQQPC